MNFKNVYKEWKTTILGIIIGIAGLYYTEKSTIDKEIKMPVSLAILAVSGKMILGKDYNENNEIE